MRTGAVGESGSIRLAGLLLVAMSFLVLVGIVDLSSVLLQRQRLRAIADSAVLAGAQAIDLSGYYEAGAGPNTRLDPTEATRAVRQHLRAAIDRNADARIRLERVWTDGAQVSVALSADLRMPLLDRIFTSVVTVESSARLSYRNGRTEP